MKKVVYPFVVVILFLILQCTAQHVAETRSLAAEEEVDADVEESGVFCWLFPPQGDGLNGFLSTLFLLPIYIAATPVCWPSLALYFLGLTETSDPVCRFFLSGCIDF